MSTIIAGSSGLTPRYVHQGQADLLIRSQGPVNHLYRGFYQHNHEKLSHCHLQSSYLSSKRERNKKSVLNHGTSLGRCFCSIVEGDHTSEADHTSKTTSRISQKLCTLIRFSRPHTWTTTVSGIISISLLPVETMADLSLNYFVEVVKAFLPALLMNIYVVALNQLSDVKSDKINKPYLPLPSGELSMNAGKAIAATCSILSFATGLWFYSPPPLSALVIYFLLGTVYSVDLPFLHWKNQPFLAAVCIVSVWALLIPFGFFIHMQKYVLGKPLVFTKSLKFGVAFQFVFSSILALFKDIPDVEGDMKFGYQSVAAHLGQEKVFWFCINVLLTAYGTAVVIGAFSPYTFNKIVIVLGHSLLAFMLSVRARSIDLTNKDSVTSAYAFVGQLFVAEYLLIPFIH